jgi:hypothetical protein
VQVPNLGIRDRDRMLAEISFGDVPSRYNYTLMCPQNVTEAHLLDRLQSLGGAAERPVEVTAVEAVFGREPLSGTGSLVPPPRFNLGAVSDPSGDSFTLTERVNTSRCSFRQILSPTRLSAKECIPDR